MKPVKYHVHASSEMIESALYLERRDEGLGQDFLDAVQIIETRIAE